MNANNKLEMCKHINRNVRTELRQIWNDNVFYCECAFPDWYDFLYLFGY